MLAKSEYNDETPYEINNGNEPQSNPDRLLESHNKFPLDTVVHMRLLKRFEGYGSILL